MIYFKENVNKKTLFTCKCDAPAIGERVMIPENPREYAVVGVISIVGSPDKTVVIQPVSSSHVEYKDYLDK